jgi:hypothetical protein
MNKVSSLIIPLVLVVAMIMGSGCDVRGEDVISGTGTIKYVNLEGGFYGIISDDQEYFDPISLIPKFQEDGLPIRFEAKIREDVTNIHMWGTVIELTSIKKKGG